MPDTALDSLSTRLQTEAPSAQLLDEGLAAWRGHRSPDLADVLEACAERLPSVKAAPTKELFSAAWLASCANAPDAMQVARLAASLGTKLPIAASYFGDLQPNYLRTKYAVLFARLDAAKKYLSPSPWLSTALTALLESATYSALTVGQCQHLYAPVVSLLTEQRDVRSVARLERLLARPKATRGVVRDALALLLPDALATLRALPGQRAPSTPAVASRDGNVLWSAVVAAPDDDAVVSVWADWLQENGQQAWGSAVAIGLAEAAGTASAAAVRQGRSLLRKHADEWLGDVAKALTHVVFHRGLLYSARVAHNAVLAPERWTLAAKAPALATLRDLSKGRGSATNLFALAHSAINLNAVDVCDATQIREWNASGPTQLQTLRLLGAAPAMLAELLKATCFPLVHTIEFDWPTRGDPFPALAKLSPRLTHVRVLARQMFAADEVTRLLAADLSLASLTLVQGPASASVQHRADGLHLVVSDGYGALTEVLRTAAPRASVTRVPQRES